MSPRRVLAALLLTLLAVGLTAPAQARPAAVADRGIPRTYDAALAHFEIAIEMEALNRFTTPSGNIYCNLGRGTKGCEIGQGRIKDPDACPGNPMSDAVGRLEFRAHRVLPLCNTDTIRLPGVEVLQYGEATTYGKYACISERQGVTCIHTSKTLGFFLHKGEYVIFNAG